MSLLRIGVRESARRRESRVRAKMWANLHRLRDRKNAAEILHFLRRRLQNDDDRNSRSSRAAAPNSGASSEKWLTS